MNAAALRWAIGGPNALSRWSLITLTPLGVLAGTLWGLRNGLTLSSWLPVVIGVHLFLIVPFLLCRILMVRLTTTRPRPWLGLVTFAFLGGLRAVMLVTAGAFMGVPLPRGAVIDFVPNGVGTGIAILGVVAVVVDGSRRHRAVVEQLAALDAEFERIRALDEAELAELEAQTVARIAGILELELRQLQPDIEHAPEHAAGQLRTLANDIVRPLSHELAHGNGWTPEADDMTAKPPRWERLTAVIADMRPANPLVPFLLIELIALPSAISERVGGVGFSAFVMLLLGGVMFALSWLVARVWPKGPTTMLRLGTLVLLYAVIGILAAWVGIVITQWYAAIYDPRWIAPFFLVITSMGVSFTTALQEHHRSDENRMAMSLARNSQLNAHVRERTRQAQRRLAKLLHSSIQAELIASAMLLTTRGGETRDGVQELDRLSTAIHECLLPSAEEPVSAQERVADLTSMWSGVLDVNIEANADVWSALDDDAGVLDAAVDVVAEGLTNAVRHGDSARVGLAMRLMGERLVVDITSTGFLLDERREGLGSRYLSEAAESWELVEDSGHIRLTASLIV